MHRLLMMTMTTIGLGGCDVVFGLEREPYGATSMYSAYEAVLDQDSLPDLVVLDRTPGADRLHVVFGDSAQPFGERLVTMPLSFRPLAYALVTFRFEPLPSVVVVGERSDGAGALALMHQRTAREFDPPIEFAFAGGGGAISAVSSVRSGDNTFVLGVIMGGSAQITKPFTLDEPTIELIELETSLTRTAALVRTASSLWVIDDDHASEIPIALDGAPGTPIRQDWPSTPSDQRVASGNVNFSGAGAVHGFSTRCADDVCTLSWHAISATAPLGIDVRELDHATITQLVLSELGAGDTYTDLAVFGLQTDGDEVATLHLDNTYNQTSFRTFSKQKVFPRTTCPELGEVVAMGAVRVKSVGAARSLLLLDRTGRGHEIPPTGPCTPLALQLP